MNTSSYQISRLHCCDRHHYRDTTAEGARGAAPAPAPARSVLGLGKTCGLAETFTKCCSFVLVVMGTPLTTTLHLLCGVTATFPSRFVKEACLSEILQRKACLTESTDFSDQFCAPKITSC